MATRKPKILTSPAKGAKRTTKQWSAAGPGVIGDPTRRSVSHNVQHKAGGMFINGSLMGANEYSTLPRSLCGALADYCVREGTDGKVGIYLRDFNVRVATLSSNSHPLQQVLTRTFDSAFKMTQKASGWRTCGCGQFVHDKLAPCSVCKPKRRRK